MNTNEALSIANEILKERLLIHNNIENDILSQTGNDYAGKYYYGKFNKNIFGLDFIVQYKCYTEIENYNVLHGRTSIKDRLLELIVYNGFKTFDNILIHELLHIYQYVKNKINYDEQGANKKLYKITGNILGDRDRNYSDTEKRFAGALYLTFPYEQDAMVHGLYMVLDKNLL